MKVLLSATLFSFISTFSSPLWAETANHGQAEVHSDLSAGHGSGKLFPTPKANPENAKLPVQPKLTEPAYWAKVSGTTTLKWSDVSDAENYHLQVATDPNFKWLTVDEQMYKGTSYDLKNLEAGMHYYWRVAATNQKKWAGSTKSYFSKSMFETK